MYRSRSKQQEIFRAGKYNRRYRFKNRCNMEQKVKRLSNRILLLSTLAFTVCFASWMINGVLVTFLVNNAIFKWSSLEIGWLLGVPVLVGSVLRLPVGMLTDKF